MKLISDLACHTAKRVHESLVIVHVNGTTFKALLDSGAMVSTITKSMCDILGIEVQPTQVQRSIRTVSHEVVRALGKAYFPINFVDINTTCEGNFLVLPSCPYQMIIGVDLLKKLGPIKLDYSTGNLRIKISNKHVSYVQAFMAQTENATSHRKPQHAKSLVYSQTCDEQLTEVFLDETITIPPKSIASTMVPCRHFVQQTIFEPYYVIDGLMIARTVNRGNGFVRLKFVNTTDEYITLYENTPVGSLDEIPANEIKDACFNEVDKSLAPKQQPLVDPIDKVDLSQSCITETQKADFIEFLKTKRAVFSKHDNDIGCIKGMSNRLCDTGDAAPIRKNPYRMPVAQKAALDSEIAKLREAGLIEHAPNSEWASPILLVRKKDDTWRLCVDYRSVNAVTKKVCYPLPHQDMVKDLLNGSGYYTCIDLKKAFWQLVIENEADRERTGFITYNATYRFLRAPFGLANSPAKFQQAISTILSGLTWSQCQVFLDDILVFSPPDYAEHKSRVGNVLDRLIKHGVKINPEKTVWIKDEVEYLGLVFNKNGSKPSPRLVEKIKNFPSPSNIKQLRIALGLISYYRKYLPGYTNIARPMLDLLKNDVKFEWTSDCEKAFKKFKTLLTSYPILRYPDFTLPFTLHCDASNTAIGGQLSQRHNGKLHPVGFFSRTLNDAERRYSTYEAEALAVVECARHFRHLILGFKTTVYSDHAPLTWLLSARHANPRLARFALKLQEFDLVMKHVAGSKNNVADALSRVYDNTVNVDENDDVAEFIGATALHFHADSNQIKTFAETQRKDSFLSKIIDYLERNIEPVDLEPHEKRHFIQSKEHYLLHDGVLYLQTPNTPRALLCVPEELKLEIMARFHGSVFGCHCGRERTLQAIRSKYYWMGLYQSVSDFVSSCVLCNQRKRAHAKPILPLSVNSECSFPLQRVQIDLLGRLPVGSKSGAVYILGIMCSFSKYVIAVPLQDKQSKTVAEALVEHLILKEGSPLVIVSDLGSEFVSEVFRELLEMLNIEKRETSPFHPAANGLIERYFSTFSNMMATLVETNQNRWENLLPFVVSAYNHTVHTATGFTPAYLFTGRDHILPFEQIYPISLPRSYNENKSVAEQTSEFLASAWSLARDNIAAAQASYKYCNIDVGFITCVVML